MSIKLKAAFLVVAVVHYSLSSNSLQRDMPIHLLQSSHVPFSLLPSPPFAPSFEGVKWCLNLVPGLLSLLPAAARCRAQKEIWAHGTIFHWCCLDIDG